MAFRDMLHGVHCDAEPVSVDLEMFQRAAASAEKGLLFEHVIEAPGHKAALDLLVRERLCDLFSVSPGELIDVLAWAMTNPETPVMVEPCLLYTSDAADE